MLPEQDELGHAVAAAVLLGPHVDDAFQAGVRLGLQVAALLRERLGYELADDLQVVHVAVGVDDAERLHVRLLEHVVQLVGLVDRVHGDHDHADLGGGVHEREPVGDVARPHAQVIPGAQADGEQSPGQVVGALVEVAVGPAQHAVGVHDELVVGVYGHLVAEVAADGLLGVKRVVGVARDGAGHGGFLGRHVASLDRRVHDGQEFGFLPVVGAHLMRHDGVVVDALARV